ncbi:MAG: transcription elongation factor GreA [Alphaproteobacteria bacterium]|nr:transcription elongation factor GreA [Alphaproteobacteria bacterium]
MDKHPLTPAGAAKLEAELKTLKTVDRPDVIAAIQEARAHGDLSENAEYHAAKERQRFIERRIGFIDGLFASCEVIDPARVAGDTIKFSATVKLVDVNTDEEKIYQIVGEAEADMDATPAQISYKSPLARALIGKRQGDAAEFQTPGGTREFEVLEIKYV